MRYQDQGEIVAVEALNWMGFGVWIALVAGLCLLLLGIYGKQQWLKFWGALTFLFCIVQLTISLEAVLPIKF